jgi:hypothetical protein
MKAGASTLQESPVLTARVSEPPPRIHRPKEVLRKVHLIPAKERLLVLAKIVRLDTVLDLTQDEAVTLARI